MKSKPISHKNENTFKFCTFGERLSSINIDVIHRVGKVSENPDDANSFFQEAIEKWNDLNYTENYGALRHDIGFEISTLSQIVFRKEELIDILLKHLNPENMALDATLEFVVALARDLQFEFYPYFPKFFIALTGLLQTRDTDLLERIFTSLSYLFKFLWRYMVKDMKNVYSLYSSLLTLDNKEHVRNFAAESFAFLIRKVQDKPKFFCFMFQLLAANEEQVQGLGRLLFEVVKGVKQQFHSCTKAILSALFSCLGKGFITESDVEVASLTFPFIEKSLETMLAVMQKHTCKGNADVVQDVFYEMFEQLMGNFRTGKISKDTFDDHCARLLHVLLTWMSYDDVALLGQTTSIITVMDKLCEFLDLPGNCMEYIMDITSLMLMSKNIDMPIASTNNLLNFVFSHSSSHLVFQFTRKMYTFGMFEKDVLPRLLQYATDILNCKNYCSTEVLEILTETVLYLRPQATSKKAVTVFTKLPLYTPEKKQDTDGALTIDNYLYGLLKSDKIDFATLPVVWCGLICLPHLKNLDTSLARARFENVIKICKDCLDNLCGDKDENKFLTVQFVMCQAFVSWLCVDGKVSDSSKGLLSMPLFLDLLQRFPTSLSILQMVNLYISYLDLNKFICDDTETVSILVQSLLRNLSSPFHKVRKLTLELLCQLPFELPKNEDGVAEAHNVFQLCLVAEEIPVTVQGYREKLQWIRKLEYPAVKKNIPIQIEDLASKAPIHYILGCLGINFSLLWQPTTDILSSYAVEDNQHFWMVFKPLLYENTEIGENLASKIDCAVENASIEIPENVFGQSLKDFCQNSETVNVINYRLLMWKSMLQFTDVVMQNHTDVVPLLFRFIEKEVVRVDDALASSEVVSAEDALRNVDITVDEDDEEEEIHDDEENEFHILKMKKRKLRENTNHDESITDDTVEGADAATTSVLEMEHDSEMNISSQTGRKRKMAKKPKSNQHFSVVKTLSSMLTLFSKLKKPGTLCRTNELKKLYYELLCYHDGGIQKLAFDCILTYNLRFLNPYKENYYRILDDKTFKTEIVLFSVDKDNLVIQANHRVDALTVLMRILYGKMLRKAGNNTTGRAQSHMRKTLVMRFLAGCHAEELKIFFDLVFEPLKEQLKSDVLTAVISIRKDLDLSSIVPLRKLRSILNTLDVILHNLGSLAPDLLPFFLKAILVIATTASALLEQRQQLLSQCVTIAKLIRRHGVMTLIQFFRSFQHYDFTPEEIDAIFEAVIWPMLPKLEFEALLMPPPLLRLLDMWSSNSRYFVFFSKHHPSLVSLSPLPHIMSLYVANNVRPRVVGLVSKMIHSFLTSPDYEMDRENGVNGQPLVVNDCLPLDVTRSRIDDDMKEVPTFGAQLLLPYVSMIIKRLQLIVGKAAKSSKRSLESRELTILLRLSSFIDDEMKCHQFIELLVPFFTHKKKLGTDCEVMVLSTIDNLIHKVENLKYFVNLFGPLFGTLSSQRSRQALVTIFSTLAKKNEDLMSIAAVVKKVNAWNPTFMEEPDYQTRLNGNGEALSEVDKMTDDIDTDFVRIIIFNCTFMIRTCEDMSLRNSSSYLLQELVKRFAKFMDTKPEIFRTIVFETLLLEIKKGLRNRTEVVRSEFVRVLSGLLHSCGSHPRLSQLAQLCDADPDMDFWENILHLQVHRRARALQKFASRLDSGEMVMSSHFLVTYMVPLVSTFFFDAAYNKHVHVIDAAIETMGVLAKKLEWPQYESNLKLYIRLLQKDAEHHKTIVKIIVTLLNGFHFDLSASRGIKGKFKLPKEKKFAKSLVDDDQSDSEELVDNLAEENEELLPNKKDLLDEDKATKIHQTIAKGILPQLYKSLTHKTKSDEEHKLAGKHYPEDEEILRVPIALAIVKLLQNLPQESLKKSISGLFLKMCNLLKSKAESIRETSRDTLVKMMQSLGPSHFHALLHEMKGVMKRGYQVHVMSFSVNAILQNLKPQLKSGDLDSSIADLAEICMNELYGEAAEEKEVAKITGKLKEARSNKSYSIYEILSCFVSEDYLTELIQPLKEKLDTIRSHKAAKKIQECLRHIALGISENAGVSAKTQLIFAHGLISEQLPLMNPDSVIITGVPQDAKYIRPDVYLIPQEPGRGGPPAKSSRKTNAHVFVDFSLQLLNLCLRREKVKPTEKEHLEMLDPYVSILTSCLDSNHIKIISTSLRCLLWFFKYPLPTLETNSAHIVQSSFLLLNKYAGVGMGQGENFEMVVMCFKMLTVIVRETNYHKLNDDQLRVLLSYIDQDIHDHTRQATAFTLLKAILAKKLQAAELDGIMSKISEMAITAGQEHIRAQSRQVSLQYLAYYPLGKNLQHSLSFYIGQLEYFHEHGRVSAIEMINSLLHSCTPEVIKRHAGMFFVPLSARLVNDDASRCRKMVSETLKTLLKKIDHDERTNLFSIVLTWMESKKTSHRRLGAQLCGIFAEIEEQEFERFIGDLLPLVLIQLEEARNAEVESNTDERCKDHFLYHLLNGFAKVLSYCKIIKNGKFAQQMDSIWEQLQRLIIYPHVWVRHATSQLFGLAFASYSIAEVTESLECNGKDPIFFTSKQKLRDLSADFATQLQSPHLTEFFGEQVIRNLVYLAKVISRLPTTENGHTGYSEDNDAAECATQVSISWMIRRVCREVKKEVSLSPQNSIKRKCVFKFLAAIALDVEKDYLFALLPDIFIPLCRELLDSSAHGDESLKSLTREVLDVYKGVLGVEEFTKIYSLVQSSLLKKKVKRKQERVKEAVTNPEKFAKKKIRKQQLKKEAKKRKILVLKGKRKAKKQKLSHLAIES